MSQDTVAFVKGSKTRLVSTASERVAAEFAGFKPASSVTAENSERAELQAQAKVLGINARQSNKALAEAIANFKPSDESAQVEASFETPETDDDGSPLGETPETDDDGSPLDPPTS